MQYPERCVCICNSFLSPSTGSGIFFSMSVAMTRWQNKARFQQRALCYSCCRNALELGAKLLLRGCVNLWPGSTFRAGAVCLGVELFPSFVLHPLRFSLLQKIIQWYSGQGCWDGTPVFATHISQSWISSVRGLHGQILKVPSRCLSISHVPSPDLTHVCWFQLC